MNATTPPSPATVPSEDRRRAGADLRDKVPRSAHAEWHAPADRRDPVDILIEQGKSRLPELLPIRYGRMQQNPFGFLRGAAAVMAADLASTPVSGIRMQACGDAHLANFGAYASPEGTPVFDINDFDETLPAPFEWDLKRLATSLVLSGRAADCSEKEARALAEAAARAYREHMHDLAGLPPLQAWSERIDLASAIADIGHGKVRDAVEKRLEKIMHGQQKQFGLVQETDGAPTIRDNPPLVFHLSKHELPAHKAFSSYAETLGENVRVLLQRHRLRDVAFKAVGVGSVGTFCAIALLADADGAPLLLQIKEAQESVLAPFAGASAYTNHGERVVTGQRMLQAATDVFLGWTLKPIDGRHYYIRRLKDSRLANIGELLETALPFYATLCGRTLARAHARSGDAVLVSGYLGNGDAFDDAITEFATAYADQTEKDWQGFKAAIKAGRITAAPPDSGKPS